MGFLSKRYRIVFAVVVLLAAAGGSALYLTRCERGPDSLITLYGNVDIREVELAFNDSGRITSVLVQEGAHVKSGQLLATLDDTRYAAALAQAKAQATQQELVLKKLVAGSRPEETAAARATMEARRATYLDAEANYKRAVNLVSTKALSIERRDDLKAAFDAARQQYEAAREAYTLTVKGPRTEDVEAARAAHQAAVDAVALAQREFDDTRLYAPKDGVVESRILEPGAMATPGTPVLTLALRSPLWIRAYVSETEFGRLRLGMRATVESDSFPGRHYEGWVGYISPTSEFTPRTVETPDLRTELVYQLRVYVCDARDELRLGMPVTVHIDLTQVASRESPDCEPRNDGGQ